MLWWRQRREQHRAETVDSLITRLPDVAELLAGLGYDKPTGTAATVLIGELLSLVRAEVPNFDAFEKALASAIARRGTLPDEVSSFLDLLAAASGRNDVLRLLNRDPIHDQVPYIEQLPVRKAGVITWKSPVRNTLIRKRPADRAAFLATLGKLEQLFSQPQPARSEQSRMALLAAIGDLREEAVRENSYLPPPFRHLEVRLEAYRASIRPNSKEWLDAALLMLERLVELRNKPVDVAACSEVAVRYLAMPRLFTPALGHYLLALLLDERSVTRTRRTSRAATKALDAIRNEVASGSFDAGETVRRLRALEPQGILAPTLVFPLLELPKQGAPANAADDRVITLVPRRKSFYPEKGARETGGSQ